MAKLSEKDDTILITPTNREILLQVLDQQSRMMMRFGKLDDRLQPLAEPFIKEETSTGHDGSEAKAQNSALADPVSTK